MMAFDDESHITMLVYTFVPNVYSQGPSPGARFRAPEMAEGERFLGGGTPPKSC